ncbi:hypothetical protein LCGC14_1339340 [marine sediment metagenome]|uniref:Uncharacterized protein n=1 Tax=marine sediment metagenome TaxID=412755 RepID=A0A0F9KEW3_9ZZZZ
MDTLPTAPSQGGSWYGYVTACKGSLLIGALQQHQSARYATQRQASAWVGTIVQGNSEAHRQISAWGTTWDRRAPQVLEPTKPVNTD